MGGTIDENLSKPTALTGIVCIFSFFIKCLKL